MYFAFAFSQQKSAKALNKSYFQGYALLMGDFGKLSVSPSMCRAFVYCTLKIALG